MLLMRRLLLFLPLAFFAMFANAQSEGFSYIQGKVEGEDSPQEIQLVRAEYGSPVICATTQVSASGSFGFAIEPLANSAYYYLYDGKSYFRICLQPSITIKVGWTEAGFNFIEPVSKANQVLLRWYSMETPLRSIRRSDPYAAFFQRFDSVEAKSKVFLEELKRIRSPYSMQMADIVRLDLLKDFVSYISKYQQSYDSEETTSSYYRNLMKKFPETSASLLSQPYGCMLMKEYFGYKQTYIYPRQKFSMDQQLAEIQNADLRLEYILANIPTGDFAKYCEYEEKYLPLLPDEDIRNRMRNSKLRPKGGMQKGEKAPNLIFQDMEGRLHSMSELSGKWVYVDIWATWCTPCKAEIPSLKALEEKYKDGNIAFVSISIDNNHATWEKFVKDKQLGGLQLWAGDWTALPSEMELGSVPRFLLIDPQGNWFDSNAPRPSSMEIKQFFREKVE